MTGLTLAQSQSNSLGRPWDGDEPVNAARQVGFTPSVMERMKQMAGSDRKVAKLVRTAVDEYLAKLDNPAKEEAGAPHWSEAGANQHSAPRFFSLPCGPWSDSLAEPDRFTVNERVYSFLEMREGDIFASTSGDSMDGAGIRDHDIVVLRPFEPGKGPVKDNIVVATITTIDGDVKSTLKRYIGKDGEKPRLVDGNGDPFDVPQDTEKVEMYYKAVARIGVL